MAQIQHRIIHLSEQVGTYYYGTCLRQRHKQQTVHHSPVPPVYDDCTITDTDNSRERRRCRPARVQVPQRRYVPRPLKYSHFRVPSACSRKVNGMESKVFAKNKQVFVEQRRKAKGVNLAAIDRLSKPEKRRPDERCGSIYILKCSREHFAFFCVENTGRTNRLMNRKELLSCRRPGWFSYHPFRKHFIFL